jgi:hypothetical protein
MYDIIMRRKKILKYEVLRGCLKEIGKVDRLIKRYREGEKLIDTCT